MGQGLTAALSLACVLLLILAIASAGRVLSRRMGGIAAPSGMTIRASLALDSKRRLHLVDARGRQVLILTGGGQDTMLPWPDPP